MKNKGFTLAELLIVIAIIGILASMVLPRLFGPAEQSRSAEARNMLGAIRQGLEAWRNGPAGVYRGIDGNPEPGPCGSADDWQALGLGDPNANPNRYFDYCVFSPSPMDQFIITATRLDGSNTLMTLNNFGTWSGDYTQVPQNPNGVACNSANELCYP